MKENRIVRILWIDDEKQDHSEDAKNLGHAQTELSVNIIHPSDLQIEFSAMKTSGNIPDLFLVDYFLDQVRHGKEEKFAQRGLSVAGIIREIEPERPIYVVTQKETKKTGVFGSEARSAKDYFDKILTFKELQREGHNILYYDALDYRSIRDSRRRRLGAIFDLLKASEEIRDKLKLVLPSELRNGLSSKTGSTQPEGNVIAFAKWTREILLAIPGLVYDEMHASTFLGMTIGAFQKVQPKLQKAKYSGIFSKAKQDLWWVLELNNIVFANPKARKIQKTNLWEVAPLVFNIGEDGLSKCAVCGKAFPETVGTNVLDDSDFRPIHFRCSIPHPKKKRELYFDEPRGFITNLS